MNWRLIGGLALGAVTIYGLTTWLGRSLRGGSRGVGSLDRYLVQARPENVALPKENKKSSYDLET